MGTASFSVSKYGDAKRWDIPSVLSGYVRTSGAHTTSGTASNIEDAGGDISLSVGEILQVHADEAMRIRFGGTAATTTTGHYIPAGQQREFEADAAGTVSIIDVA